MIASNLLLTVLLVIFISHLSAYVIVSTTSAQIPQENVSTEVPVASQPQTSYTSAWVNPTSVNQVPQTNFNNNRYYYPQQPRRRVIQRSQFGQRFFSPYYQRWMNPFANKRSFLTSLLGTNPYMGYYRGQMVKNSPISPGGGMFVHADGTDGTIINADGSRTSIDGSDVSIDHGF